MRVLGSVGVFLASGGFRVLPACQYFLGRGAGQAQVQTLYLPGICGFCMGMGYF